MKEKATVAAKRLGVAILAVTFATIVRFFCYELFNETIPYTPFYPAIVIATIYGRAQGGAFATILAGFAASFWLTPFGKPLIEEWTDTVGLVLFVAVSGLVVYLCEGMRRSKELAHKAAEERKHLLVQAQSAREAAEEANRLKDVFLASVSHELRTPLQAILGWAQLLTEHELKTEERAQGLAIIANNAKVQAYLVEDLLDMSRIVSGKMRLMTKLVNPQYCIDAAIQTVSLAARTKQIRIVTSYEADTCVVNADPDRLQQIVWNLLSNSIKFSPPHSVVTVTLKQTDRSIQIQVKDEGQGIPPEFLPNVFQMFRQVDDSASRQHSGLGLGLSIVRNLVELHGGTISADSAGLGRGTTMTILIPNHDEVDSSTRFLFTAVRQ